MSTDRRTRTQQALAVGWALTILAALVTTGLLLQKYGPGNMGAGFLSGAAGAIVVAGAIAWRVRRRPERTTTFERAWTKQGDERDDVVLTRALAVLGLLALPLTAIAAIAIGFGAPVEMTIALLLFAQLGVGAIAFVVTNRRS